MQTIYNKYFAIARLNHDTALSRLKECLSVFHIWFFPHGLALNRDKADAILLGTIQRAKSIPLISNIDVAGARDLLSNNVKLPGIKHSHSTFDTLISKISHSYFYRIRAFRRICQPYQMTLPEQSSTLSLVADLTTNSVLHSSTPAHTGHLARVVTLQSDRISISMPLKDLHRLPVKWRIDFNVATLTYIVLESGETSYLFSLIVNNFPHPILIPHSDHRPSPDSWRFTHQEPFNPHLTYYYLSTCKSFCSGKCEECMVCHNSIRNYINS